MGGGKNEETKKNKQTKILIRKKMQNNLQPRGPSKKGKTGYNKKDIR